MRFRFPLALVAAALLTACSYGGTKSPAPPIPPPPVAQPQKPTVQAPKPQAASVTIRNFAFAPAALSVSRGTTVTWTNNDTAPHKIDASDKFPDSPTLNQGQSYSYTFTEAGTFPYYCSIHPSMKASVEVLP